MSDLTREEAISTLEMLRFPERVILLLGICTLTKKKIR